MRFFIGAAIVLTTIAAMECLASAVHRHVMHGWGWAWHQCHHQKRGRGLEKNDLYAVVFAAPALGLIAVGSTAGPAYWCGIGITVYGLLYALMHDGLVHRRLPFFIPGGRPDLRRPIQGHHPHPPGRRPGGGGVVGVFFSPPPPGPPRRAE